MQWACPTPAEQNMAYYPDRAQRLGKEGFADIDCLVAASGAVISCALNREIPPGFGFGEKALHIGCLFKFKPASDPNAPPAWTKNKLVHFNLSR